jgi:hypothetical protein
MALQKRYHRFWPGFYTDFPNDFTRFFDMLLDPLRIDRQVVLHSVFPDNPGELGGAALHISYSGEPHNLEPKSDYDLNLIMQATSVADKVVCVPLFIVASYVHNFWSLYKQPRPLPEKRHFCVFVVSNPGCAVRNRFFAKLSTYKPVHSAGRAMNNCGMLAPENDMKTGKFDYFNFLSMFKFIICFENSPNPENLTEKLHNAWLGCTIPIHWGGGRCTEWFNSRAFLQLPASATDAEMDELIDRVKYLDEHDDAYMEMYNQPLCSNIHEDLTLDHIRGKIGEVLKK